MVFAGGAARVDVDRDQRLGLVDDDIATGAQLHGRREHGVQLALDAHAREQRLAVAIEFDRAHARRHQHLHEVARLAIAGFARHLDLVDLLVVEVAQRALDQRAFLVDQGRRLRLQGQIAHGLPHPDQIFEVALDLGLGAGGAGSAQDDAHALGHVEILHHFLQPRAVLRRSDLAADAAAARGVGHQHRITSGERQIGGQRRALVAALFLDDLHQHHLAALDDFLDLVLAARAERPFRHFLHHVVATDGLDEFLLGFLAVLVFVVHGIASRCGDMFAFRSQRVLGVLGAGVLVSIVGMGDVFPRPLFLGALVVAVGLVELGCERLVQRGRNGGLDRGGDRRLGMMIIGRSFGRGIVGMTGIVVGRDR